MAVPESPTGPGARGAPLPWLLADIGGTNARFAWLDGTGGTVQHLQTLPVAAFADPLLAARSYLAALQQVLGPRYRPPRAAAWALAAAIVGDEIELTNSGWRLGPAKVQRELGLETLLVLNDFEALALSLPRLLPGQLRRVAAAPGQVSAPLGTRAVIGPGTGLGVAGLVSCPVRGDEASSPAVRWLPIPGEGGHVTLAPADDFESALLAAARRQHEHVSGERLLSGTGLPVLHQALAQVRGVSVPALGAEAVVAAGTAAERSADASPLCRETLEHFCALLGSVAGNLALTLGARGGVYIGGGIVPRLGPLFERSRFRERFEAKGRLAPYLATIPTWLIADTHAALSGAAMALQQHHGRP